jgi:hypothetical protein
MDSFDLDLRHAEGEMDGVSGDRVVLGVLDGSDPPAEWVDEVTDGNVLLLDVVGDLDELAAPFAGDIRDIGGSLMHFRGFLVVAPPGIEVDTDRLGD